MIPSNMSIGCSCSLQCPLSFLLLLLSISLSIAALTENGVLSGYLQIMKDLTSQVGKVQSFLQEHVSLLEEHSYKAAKGIVMYPIYCEISNSIA